MKLKVWNYIVIGIMVALIGGMIAADCVCNFWSAQITNLLCGTGLDFSGEDVATATAESDKLINNIGDESIVLLKNAGGENGNGILPLAESNRKINLFGWASHDDAFVLTGGGSGAGWIVDDKKVPIAKGLENSGFTVNRDLLDKYKAHRRYRDGLKLSEPSIDFYTDDIINAALAFSDTAIITIMRFGSEGVEIPLEQNKSSGTTDSSRTYLQLSTEEEALIELVTEKFDKVIVVLDTANSMELGFLDNEKIDAALLCGMLGQSGSNAIGRILTGEVNPSAKTVDTYPYDHRSNPSYANMRRDGNHIHYVEDIYIGYKWYETAFADKLVHEAYGKTFDYSDEEGYRNVVQYPFGYGLSYTEFKWSVDSVEYVLSNSSGDLADADIYDKKAKFEVKVAVTNTGGVKGRDVVQVYFTAPYDREANAGAGGIEKAALNLIAFEKTPELEPGQTANLTLTFDLYDMASYDCYDRNGNGSATYELDAGEYKISVMDDAHTLADCENAVTSFDLSKTITYKLDPKTNSQKSFYGRRRVCRSAYRRKYCR